MAAFNAELRNVDSELVDRYIGNAPQRNDTLAGPRMRRADLACLSISSRTVEVLVIHTLFTTRVS